MADSMNNEKSRKVELRYVALAGLAFPSVALVAVGVYWGLRRKWPDRLMAKGLIVSGLVVAGPVVLITGALEAWWRIVRALAGGRSVRFADVLEMTVVGLALGLVVGGVWWLAGQKKREKSPFSGQGEEERRRAVEERRRRLTTHVVQRLHHTGPPFVQQVTRPFAVPLGDEAGPFLGRFHRGDLPATWSRRRTSSKGIIRVPMVGPNAPRHLVVLGGTGLGKTETILRIAEWGISHGQQVVYLACKEPPSLEESVAPRLAAIAEAHGSTFRNLVPEYSPWDPMRGSPDAIRDRLIRIESWGDSYWSHCANVLIALALDLNAAAGQPLTALPELVYSLTRGRLLQLAQTSNDPRVVELVQALNKNDVGGALMRYASMALHLRGFVAPADAGGWSYEDAEVVCLELPFTSRPEAGAALMRLVMRDFGSYLVDDQRRMRTPDGSQRRPMLFIGEEIGAVAHDPVIGGEFINTLERARSAGGFAVLSAQDFHGLGNERAQLALKTNAAILSFRQTAQAEDLAKLIGTELVMEAGADYDHDIKKILHQGVARIQHGYKLNPQRVRELGHGEFVIAHAGQYAKAAAAMSRYGYGLPETKAVVEVRRSIVEGRQFQTLPLQSQRTHDTTTAVAVRQIDDDSGSQFD